MNKYLVYILLLTLTVSCNKSGETAINVTAETTDMESNKIEGYDPTTIEMATVSFEIQTPGKKLIGTQPEIFTDEAGVINVIIGKNYHLEITEQEMNINHIVAELKKDIFYKTNIIDQSEDQVTYTKSLPDGSQSFVHFAYSTVINDQPISIRSSKNGLYRKSHIDRMIKSARSVLNVDNNTTIAVK